MVKRRSMVVGLGALATGSGAVFSSAAFASSVSPSADMRVVVGQNFGNNLRVTKYGINKLLSSRLLLINCRSKLTTKN